MKSFSLAEAARAAGGTLCGAPGGLAVTGVTIDSRKVKPGDIFVAIHGDRFDGHDYIESAARSGAVCSISEKPCATAHILVKDTLDAYQSLAAYYRSLFSARVVGITGSAGKTTTKEFIASVLSQSFDVLKSEGNLNNQTGMPQNIFRLETHNEAAVIEMGTNHFGEIDRLAAIAAPDICVFTNIGTAHIEFLGSREGILKAKCEMLAHMRKGGRVIVNGDDDMLATLRSRGDVISYGMSAKNDVYAKDIEEKGLFGTEVTICAGKSEFRVFVPAPGEHMILNALAAAAVGLEFGMTGDYIARGIAAYAPVGGRMSPIDADGFMILNDVYNANPDSMRASIGVLAKAQGRRVAILGGMGELGEDSDELHRQVGEFAAKSGADLLITVGEAGAKIAEGAGEAKRFSSQDELIAALPGLIKKNDTVLVKASRAFAMEHTVEALKKLSIADRERR